MSPTFSSIWCLLYVAPTFLEPSILMLIRPDEFCWPFFLLTLSFEFFQVIDACTKGNLGRFINHSCSPNCRTEKVDFYFTDFCICIVYYDSCHLILKPVRNSFLWLQLHISCSALKNRVLGCCSCTSKRCPYWLKLWTKMKIYSVLDSYQELYSHSEFAKLCFFIYSGWSMEKSALEYLL